jgi:hypothetical protein
VSAREHLKPDRTAADKLLRVGIAEGKDAALIHPRKIIVREERDKLGRRRTSVSHDLIRPKVTGKRWNPATQRAAWQGRKPLAVDVLGELGPASCARAKGFRSLLRHRPSAPVSENLPKSEKEQRSANGQTECIVPDSAF